MKEGYHNPSTVDEAGRWNTIVSSIRSFYGNKIIKTFVDECWFVFAKSHFTYKRFKTPSASLFTAFVRKPF